MTPEEFAEEFDKLRKRGFVKSLRNGPTGIGYTLETLLGITENNLHLPDLPGIELKASRSNSASLTTLFTLDRGAWIMDQLDAVREFGTIDRNPERGGRLGLYHTMSRNPNSSGLRLDIDSNSVSIVHSSGKMLAQWQLDALADRFMEKMPSLLFVSANSEKRPDGEYFHYERASILSGSSPKRFREQFLAGSVVLDLRIHDKGSSARNHGTGFRVYERNLPLLFDQRQDL